jgi:hypothetical protein
MRICEAALVVAVIFGGLLAPRTLAQTTNPSYIAEFPAVDKVMKAMQTNDPDETAARQMAALTQLKKMVEDMSGPRQYQRGGLTADELKMRQAYYTAYYNITKSKPQYAPFTAMRGLDFSGTFRNQLIHDLFPPAFAAEYAKVMGQAKQQSAQLHQQAVQAAQAQQQQQQAAAQQWANNTQQRMAQSQQPPQDPETRKMNRCVAAGRLPATCLGNGLMGSLMSNVNGLLSSVAPGVVGKEVTGPQMSGAFAGSGWRLEFSEASVGLSCANMNSDSHSYTIAIVNNRAVITISSTPKDVVLLISGDTLTGAGPIVVNGTISLGAHDGYDYTGKPATVYEYQRVTRTCPRPVLTSKGAGPGVVDAEANLLKGMFSDGDTGTPTPPGLRMNGSYASPTGFSVDFYPESAIIGCGPDAARAYPYSVEANGAQAAVKIAAPDHPLALAMKPDGSLDPGSGPYQVHGRTITGKDDNDNFTFAPLEVTCNLGVLKPGPVPSGYVPATANASASTPAATPTPSNTPRSPGSPASSNGNAVLSIASGIPGTPNPLAGHAFVLLRDSLESTLAKGGFQVPAGASAYKTMIMACANKQPTCQTAINALNANTATGIRIGPDGKGTFPGVPAGSYYVMGAAPISGHPFLWDCKVDLKPGTNAVTLSQSNATPVN